MNRLSLSICTRSRHDLLRSSINSTPLRVFTRERSATSVSKKGAATRKTVGTPSYVKPALPPPRSMPLYGDEERDTYLTPSAVASYLASNVKQWASDKRVSVRLQTFGIDIKDVVPLLSTYSAAIRGHTVLSALEYDAEHLTRMAQDLGNRTNQDIVDRYLTRLLFEWADHTTGQAALRGVVTPSTCVRLSEFFRATDLSLPASWFPGTRAAPPRKVIMHVGPTNSGKTHNALRALAAARTGVYAGPLRLLAHEIWERLNRGQIIPLGVEVREEEVEKDPNINFDVGSQPVIKRDGDKRYARKCNMLTGEEQKIVDEHATLVSCTVEMAPLTPRYDVAVVDEIQLLGDEDRGGAWLRAVLGLSADELHLCGEETAVPLVEALLRDTGDELVVNRYQRLTPLTVAKRSLDGDLSAVQRGDCIVTFSRKQLFVVKKRVEELTGMKCAVAYGRLPPEIRSEQAALFNRLDSGYDVLVGSDAIGMGLNLKIKRIVLEAVQKFNGTRSVPLSTSQLKQIAGRAGRYGLLRKNTSGGIATTIHQVDLPVLARALASPISPLRVARVPASGTPFENVAACLPRGATNTDVLNAIYYVSKLHPCCEVERINKEIIKAELLSQHADRLTVADRMMIQLVPIPNGDENALQALRIMTRMFADDGIVKLRDALREARLLDRFDAAISTAKESGPGTRHHDMLEILETVHKVLVMYLWLTYRQPIVFGDQEEAFVMRDTAERAMQSCLLSISAVKSLDRASRHPVRPADWIQYKNRIDVHKERAQKRIDRFEEMRQMAGGSLVSSPSQ